MLEPAACKAADPHAPDMAVCAGVVWVCARRGRSVCRLGRSLPFEHQAWPCNDPIKAPFKREDCAEIGAPVVEAGAQCSCEATTVYYVKGVETLLVAFEHGYKVRVRVRVSWCGLGFTLPLTLTLTLTLQDHGPTRGEQGGRLFSPRRRA